MKTRIKNSNKTDYFKEGFDIKNVTIKSNESDIFNVINNIFFVINKFDLSIEDVLSLIYVYEIGVFPLRLVFFSKRHDIGHLYKRGFIKEEYSFKGKKLYSLSSEGFNVVDSFKSSFKEKEKYLLFNKTIHNNKKVPTINSRYFNKK